MQKTTPVRRTAPAPAASLNKARRLQEAAANLAGYALQCRALPALQTHLARVVAGVLRASRVGIFELLPAENVLVWRSGWGWSPETVHDLRLARWQGIPIRMAIDRGLVEQTRLATACPMPLGPLDGDAPNAAFAGVVVEGREAPWGLLTAHWPASQDDEEERFFLRIAANTLGAIVHGMAMEAKLDHLASHDPLTGLPNRVGLLASLDRLLAQAERPAVALGWLALDRVARLDHLLGHDVDALLATAAQRLRTALPEDATVARIGNDELAVLLPGLAQPEHAAVFGRKLLAQFDAPFDVDGEEIVATACLGIAFSADAPEAETMARHAAMALHRAKQHGPTSVHCYGTQLNIEFSERLQLEHGLRRAVRNAELALHYQPRMAMTNGAIVGVEALVRWQHPERGLLFPGAFVPIAEESGLINEVDEWVLRESMRAMRHRIDRDAPEVMLSVNLSAAQFRSHDIVRVVDAALRELRFPPHRLELEITESAFIGNMEAAMETLEQLRCLGVRIAIDDFGSGYSSLSYLRRFPVDVLKVDRSLVHRIPGDAQDMAIARAVVALGHALHLEVVAEGVETSSQLAAVQALGCDQVQGYYVARALPLNELCAYLAARGPAHDA